MSNILQKTKAVLGILVQKWKKDYEPITAKSVG